MFGAFFGGGIKMNETVIKALCVVRLVSAAGAECAGAGGEVFYVCIEAWRHNEGV